MIVYVYRNGIGDCTNGGLSAKHNEVFVDLGEGDTTLGKDTLPHFRLESHVKNCVRLAPVEEPLGKAGPMFGGNYGASSDSRFTAAVEKLLGTRFYGAVAIHDRFEG